MNKRNTVLKENIIKLFEYYSCIKIKNNEDNNIFENNIIKEYKKNNRTILKIKIFFDKDKDGNPYYSSNAKLHKCSQLLQELCSFTWDCEMPLNVCNIINGLYELLFGSSAEVSLEDKIDSIYKCSEVYISNICLLYTSEAETVHHNAG